MLRSHRGSQAGKVQHEDGFIDSANTLHVSKQSGDKPLAGAELQVVFATGYRLMEQKRTICVENIKYVSQATRYLTPQRHVPKPNLYTLRQNRFLHILKSPVT